MEYCFTIDKFEGPLDLLLHLIKESNIDIYDIRIEEIVDQYLDYIQKMEQLNLDIASSYLVMAAELIEIKASLLLPKPVIEKDEYEEDPKENLIKRLIEYKNYKEAVSKFQELEILRQEYYTKEASDINDFEISPKLDDNLSLTDLLQAFEKFLNRKEFSKPLNTKIANKEYSIVERSKQIKEIIKKQKEIKFSQLFDIKNKGYIIITFLSILSMAKNNEIQLVQQNNFEDIIISGV